MINQEERTRAVLIQWLDRVLAQTKWSKTKLAEVAGVNQTTITRFFGDAREGGMNAVTIAKIAAASGIAPPRGLGAEPKGGFAEAQVAPYLAPKARSETLNPNQTQWTVETDELVAIGMLRGDLFILDQAEIPQAGDQVIAQIYNLEAGSAQTVIRLYHPPFLFNPARQSAQPEYVDNERVRVIGVIIRSWREHR